MNPLRTALVLPQDHPLSERDLKRVLLVFDRAKIPPDTDDALFNNFEFTHKHANMTVQYTTRVPYARSPGYKDSYSELLNNLRPILHDHLVETANVNVDSEAAAIFRERAYAFAIANKALLEAATPERSLAKPEIVIGDGVYHGLHLGKPAGELPPPARLEGVDDAWELVGWSRIGKALKYLLIASASGSVPVALDEPTSRILEHVSIPGEIGAAVQQHATDISLSWDLFNREELDKLLEGMTWRDIRDLRRSTLPAVSAIRDALRGKQLVGRANGLSAQREALAQMRKEFHDAKEQAQEALTKTVIAGALNTAGSMGATGITEFVVPSFSWMGCICFFMLGLGTLKAELQAYIPKRIKHKEHPLFHLDRIAPIRRP